MQFVGLAVAGLGRLDRISEEAHIVELPAARDGCLPFVPMAIDAYEP